MGDLQRDDKTKGKKANGGGESMIEGWKGRWGINARHRCQQSRKTRRRNKKKKTRKGREIKKRAKEEEKGGGRRESARSSENVRGGDVLEINQAHPLHPPGIIWAVNLGRVL
jgi:hypothetical protein